MLFVQDDYAVALPGNRMRRHLRKYFIFVAGRKVSSGKNAHGEGVACASVVGPPNLEFFVARHREVLNIPLDPPGNGPDVTQINFFRQYDSKLFC